MRVDHDGDLTNQYVQAFRNKHVFDNFGSQYPQHLIEVAVNADAVSQSVNAMLQQNSIDYVSAAGHGTYDTFIGRDGSPIWDYSQNLGLFSGKIVHLLACQTGALLGREIIQQGAKAFWGYTVNFVFKHSAQPTSLDKDNVAEVFIKMDIIIDRGVLAGKNAADIYDSIERYMAKVLLSLPALDRGLLLSNFVHLACPAIDWGDRAAVL